MAHHQRCSGRPRAPLWLTGRMAQQFLKENYGPTYEARDKRGDAVGTRRLGVTTKNRRWGEGLGAGLGTFLMSTTWMCVVLLLVTLTAVPFWAMAIVTQGFFGQYSTAIADARRSGAGIPYMQPYALREGMRVALATVLPALNLGAILEDKDERDLTSYMRFGSDLPFGPWNLQRDWFLLSALPARFAHLGKLTPCAYPLQHAPCAHAACSTNRIVGAHVLNVLQ